MQSAYGLSMPVSMPVPTSVPVRGGPGGRERASGGGGGHLEQARQVGDARGIALVDVFVEGVEEALEAARVHLCTPAVAHVVGTLCEETGLEEDWRDVLRELERLRSARVQQQGA